MQDSRNSKLHLSAFDEGNLSNIIQSNKKSFNKLKSGKFNNLTHRYNLYKDNLLDMRRSLSNDKKKEYDSLVDKLRNKKINDLFSEDCDDDISETENEGIKRTNEKNPLLKAIVNPNDKSVFSRYYLPRNRSMLLSRENKK